MYYIYIQNEQINGSGLSRNITEGVINFEVDKNLYDAFNTNPDMYIYSEGKVIVDPDYKEKQAQKEAERIEKLKVTKRVFALALQQFGITYTQLKELIATNEQAQLEWDLCVELERSNPLLDIMGAQMNITPDELNYIFQKANGEDVDPPVEPTEETEPTTLAEEQVSEAVEPVEEPTDDITT